MKSAVLVITNRCNFSCGTCLRGAATAEDLPLGSIDHVLDFLQPLGLKSVALSGGEPILHPEFAGIVDSLARRKLHFHVVTNGWLIDRYLPYLQRYRELVNHVAISLDGDTARVHDANRRRGSYKRTVEAIARLRKEGFKVLVSHIVNRHNFEQLHSLARHMREAGVVLKLGRVIESPDNQDWQLDARQKADLRIQATALLAGCGDQVGISTSLGVWGGILYCPHFFNMESTAVRFDGKISFCCDALPNSRGAVLGSINDGSLGSVLAQHGRKVGEIVARRIEALATGKPDHTNDCDFCNRVLAEGH